MHKRPGLTFAGGVMIHMDEKEQWDTIKQTKTLCQLSTEGYENNINNKQLEYYIRSGAYAIADCAIVLSSMSVGQIGTMLALYHYTPHFRALHVCMYKLHSCMHHHCLHHLHRTGAWKLKLGVALRNLKGEGSLK